MDYSIKLKTDRYRISTVNGRDFNEEMESDRGRALTSAALRRLQQKTQVFPLEKMQLFEVGSPTPLKFNKSGDISAS